MEEFIAQYGVLVLALAGCGLVSGLAAGLFGIGGGAIIVPVLIILFEGLGFTDSASHVAIATSLATIILTSARSVMAHHERGAVEDREGEDLREHREERHVAVAQRRAAHVRAAGRGEARLQL
ncbi:MAG: sulfite exporter TauE/SafE family protein, partial [Pseudomonadota bacterium]|nr:sulfite exporter TauE/SafE family protein [Pseudomonadota bacterium]